MALPLNGPDTPPEAFNPVEIPPKHRIARSFGRKAATYRKNAAVQSDLVGRLVDLVAACRAENPGSFSTILDAGCGTGLFADLCREAGIPCRITGLDIALGALASHKKKRPRSGGRVAGDMECLPFKPHSFDATVIASSLQWLDDPMVALREVARVLKPGGFLAFSVFAQGSFAEILATRATFGLPAPVRCPDIAALEGMLRDAGFDNLTYELVTHKVFAADALTNLKGVAGLGGGAAAGKALTRKQIDDFCLTYEARFRTREGVPLTYRTALGLCRRGMTK